LNVGEPVPVEYSRLQPQIESVEVLREDDDDRPQHIRLKGKGFMVFPKFSYALIDGEFGFGYQTEVMADGSAETVVHLPNPKSFDINAPHTVIYATPFGVTFKEF